MKLGIQHVSLNICEKYVPLVSHLDIVVIMLLLRDYILAHFIMYNLPS
jgi:hypothetical protein